MSGITDIGGIAKAGIVVPGGVTGPGGLAGAGTVPKSPPVNTVIPSISGTTTEGQTLSTTNGTWTGAAPITYAYQWKRSGVAIGGATSSTYLLQAADVGTTITVTVTATNGDGSASATSNATATIQAAVAGPAKALSLASASNQFLSMTDANFGAYDRAKFAISVWAKRASTGAQHVIFGHMGTNGSRSFNIQFNTTNKLVFNTYTDGSNINGSLITTASYTDTSNYMHILVHYDSANATAGDRMRMWVNGTEVTSFGTDTNPTAAVFDSASDVNVGCIQSNAGFFNGLIYELGFFSGTLPDISTVYNAGHPVEISSLPGLYSYLDCAGNSPISDGVLSTDWTNNNSVTTSATIPT